MKIALLGYGKEGQATEKYFKKHLKTYKIASNDLLMFLKTLLMMKFLRRIIRPMI